MHIMQRSHFLLQENVFSPARWRDSLVKTFSWGRKCERSEHFLLLRKCLVGPATLRGGFGENQYIFGWCLAASLTFSGSNIFLSPFDALQDRLGANTQKRTVWATEVPKGHHLRKKRDFFMFFSSHFYIFTDRVSFLSIFWSIFHAGDGGTIIFRLKVIWRSLKVIWRSFEVIFSCFSTQHITQMG